MRHLRSFTVTLILLLVLPLRLFAGTVESGGGGFGGGGFGGGGSGGPVQTLTIASGVTSNSVGATVAGVVGVKSFYGEVVGTGAVTATISLYCARVASATPTAATAVLLGTITLSGTTQHQDMTPVSTAACKNIFPVFTSITGTGATVLVEAWY